MLCLDAPPPRTGPIDCRAAEDIRKDPYSLPASFQWSDLNLDNDEEVGTACALHAHCMRTADALVSLDEGGGHASAYKDSHLCAAL